MRSRKTPWKWSRGAHLLGHDVNVELTESAE